MSGSSADFSLAADFAADLAKFAPFEQAPHLAVAVSGGSDSMALVLLASHWAASMGGTVTALTVDHGLRDEAAEEARQVGRWLNARGIKHQTLKWDGVKPLSGLQDAARRARYRLIGNWCRDNAVMHVLVGHTMDDQAETLLMRLERGSGPDGLAAMSAVREMYSCRLLRPIMGMRREDLQQFLRHHNQAWLDDPSDVDLRFARARLRNAGQFDNATLSESARRYGLARQVLEFETDTLLAKCCRVHSHGFAHLELPQLLSAPEDLALRALGRMIGAIGGRAYLPRRDRVETILQDLRTENFWDRTLGHCVVSVQADQITVYREHRNFPAVRMFKPGLELHWDGRFHIGLGALPTSSARGLHLTALSRKLWDRREMPENQGLVPEISCQSAIFGLPVLADDQGLFSAPHLGYQRRAKGDYGEFAPDGFEKLQFQPRLPLSNAGFCVA